MKTSTIIWVVVVLIILGGGIYLLMSQNMSTATAQQATTTTQAVVPALTVANNAQIPNYLAAANGMALYTYKDDTSGVSNCTGSCAAIWPPYTVSSAAGLSVGANIPGTIGTIARSDGTLQVTYNGMPLYFFAKDTSGQVTGNGQGGFSVATVSTASQAAAPQTAPAPQPAAPAAPTQPTPAPTPYVSPGY